MLKIKIDITRRLLVQMALFIAVVSSAVLADIYFEDNPQELKSIQAESKNHSTEASGDYILSQSNSTGVETVVQKSSARKLQVQSHDKFLRKYHQIRNCQILKAEAVLQTTPLIQSYHYLVFQRYLFSQPEIDPMA